jgi:hypothetical protein
MYKVNLPSIARIASSNHTEVWILIVDSVNCCEIRLLDRPITLQFEVQYVHVRVCVIFNMCKLLGTI